MKSKSIFVKRQVLFQKKMPSWGIELFVCDHPVDIFYLTGMKLSAGTLFVHKNSIMLFVDGRYIESGKKEAHCPVRLQENGSWEKLLSSDPWKNAGTCGFDTSIAYQKALDFKNKLKRVKMKGLKSPLLALRAIKDQTELRHIKKSAALLWQGFLHLLQQLKVGVEERELALEFEIYCRKQGAEALAFSPIIAFGSSTSLPHYHPGKRKLKTGEIVLMDLGVVVDGYASDMTRVHFFGKVSSELKALYQVVDRAKAAALKLCLPGVSLSEVDGAARKVMKEAGLEKHFLHSLGHGIGLDVHELPSFREKNTILEPGMVLTIEPGLYLPKKGGVRLEDMVIITKAGHQNLFNDKKVIP